MILKERIVHAYHCAKKSSINRELEKIIKCIFPKFVCTQWSMDIFSCQWHATRLYRLVRRLRVGHKMLVWDWDLGTRLHAGAC